MDPRLAPAFTLGGYLVLLPATWRWYRRCRAYRADPPGPGYETGTRPLNIAGLTAGVLLCGSLGPVTADGAVAAMSLASTIAPLPRWLLDISPFAPLAAAAAVLAGGYVLGAQGLGVWGDGYRPRLLHFPLAVLLPVVAVALWPVLQQAAADLRSAAPAAPAALAAAAEVPPAAPPAPAEPPAPPLASVPGPVTCSLPGDAEIGGFRGLQLAHAATIVAVGHELGAPVDAQEIAVATGMQESSLRVLANPVEAESLTLPNDGIGTDHDSLGTFQQRPGWGSIAERMDPRTAARLFYEDLLRRDWAAMSFAEAAQAVQRSKYPDAYARWESTAESVVAATTCTPDVRN